jgi:hypothetical protein
MQSGGRSCGVREGKARVEHALALSRDLPVPRELVGLALVIRARELILTSPALLR